VPMSDPPTQIAAGIDQFVMLTRIGTGTYVLTCRLRVGGHANGGQQMYQSELAVMRSSNMRSSPPTPMNRWPSPCFSRTVAPRTCAASHCP
jgi:hypothetical protein